MNINDKKLNEIYLGVSGDYNKSSLATDEGWVHKTSEFGFIELKKLVNYLPKKNARLLDIGTGMGIVPIVARKLGASVISVDSIDATGKSAIQNVEKFGVFGQFCDICVDKLPLDDNSIDCVFFGDVIEHLIHSPKRALEEIYRVLKPGGVCIATTPNATRLTVRLRVFLGYSNWANINEYFDSGFHGGHHHEYTPKEFRNVFLLTGFEVVEFVLWESSLKDVVINNVDDIPTQGRCHHLIVKEKAIFFVLKKILFAITSLFPNLRSNMLLVARKKTVSI